MKNSNFWNNQGAKKIFTHPLNKEWLMQLDKEIRVLDFGCGYGRLTPILNQMGFKNITGYDASSALIKRANIENQNGSYTDNLDTLKGQYFDMVLCFALFTSCPAHNEQIEIVNQINHMTNKGSLLYISDYLMHDNPKYKQRYQEQELGILGCFRSSEAIFRHHNNGHFDKLFLSWKKLDEMIHISKTLNANPIIIHQYLYQK